MTTKNDSEKFLSRWSKRKLDSNREENVQSSKVKTDAEKSEHLAQLEANRAAAESIDLESIDKETDFSVFFKDGVPESLKKTALAALWKSNPIFANLDGLVDYGEDFANPALNMETFQSAYEIGKGYLKKLENMADNSDENDSESGSEESESRESVASTQKEKNTDSNAEQGESNEDPIEGDSQEIGLVQNEIEDFPKVSLRNRLQIDH